VRYLRMVAKISSLFIELVVECLHRKECNLILVTLVNASVYQSIGMPNPST